MDRPLGPLVEGNANIADRWTAIEDIMRSSFAYHNNSIVVIGKERFYHFGTDGTLLSEGVIYNWFEALDEPEVILYQTIIFLLNFNELLVFSAEHYYGIYSSTTE